MVEGVAPTLCILKGLGGVAGPVATGASLVDGTRRSNVARHGRGVEGKYGD